MGDNTAAARVGFVTVVALVLAGGAWAWLVRYSPRPHGYDLDIMYHDVDGLAPGAPVLLMGVPVGRVLMIKPAARTVLVQVEITSSRTKILDGSTFHIDSQGLIGDKALEVFPPDGDTTATYADGSIIDGADPVRLDATFAAADRMVKAIDHYAESPEAKETFAEGLASIKSTFTKINLLSDHLNALVEQADRFVGHGSNLVGQIHDSDVREMVTDLEFLTHGLRKSYQALLGSPGQHDSAHEAIENLASLSARLDRVASQLETFTADPKLRSNLTDIVAQTKDILASLHGPANRHTPAFSPRLELLGLNQTDASQNPSTLNTLAANLSLRLGIGNTAFNAGAEEIGQNTLFDLTWGMPDFFAPNIGFHLGLIRSKMGVGIDLAPLPGTELSAELFDPVRTQVRLSALLFPDFLAHRYGLDFEWIQSLQRNEPNYSSARVGIQWRPLD